MREPKEKRGRSANLIRIRDEKLLNRFDKLFNIDRLRLDDTLKQLSEKEFFISEITIWKIIKKQSTTEP